MNDNMTDPTTNPGELCNARKKAFFSGEVFSEVSNGSQLRTSGGIDPMKKQELKDSTEY